MKFTVVEATKKKDVEGRNGPMQVIGLGLIDEAGTAVAAEWYTRADTALPQPASTLDGDVEDGPYGKKFKKAAPAFGGGGGFRQKDPAERRSIAMQSSLTRAVEVVRLAHDLGWKPDGEKPVSALADAVAVVARKFYKQVLDAEAGK
jgi:hypothetical protein